MIWTYTLPCHKDIKYKLLSLIKKCQGEEIENDNDKISKTDYYLKGMDMSHYEYFNTFNLHAKKDGFFDKLLDKYRVNSLDMGKVWYQQYYKSNNHNWHSHPFSNLSAIYFLEIADKRNNTEFVDQDKIIRTDAEEGDVIIFPSYMIHRAPMIQNFERKTTINFTINLGVANHKELKKLSYSLGMKNNTSY